MIEKLELKSCHEVIDTVDVANIENIFYGGKPTDPDILTVVMKGGKRLYCDEVCPIDSLQEELVSHVWHDASREQPKEKKVCLIVWNAKSGASTSNLEVAIANPQERRFVTESYPHKTGRQFTIHGENTFSVYEYMDKRDYIPFSDADKWAYADDLLKEPTFDDFIQEGDKVTVNEDGSRFNRSQLERVIASQKEPVSEELEEEIKKLIYDVLFDLDGVAIKGISEYIKVDDIAFLARYFAEWGKNHIVDNNEMVSEELEKAADEWDGSLYRSDAFIAGANWQKQQMMKDAIEREVKVDAGGYPYIDATELYDYENEKPLAKAGDKVKVVFIKDK